MKRTLIGMLMLCILLISASVSASPKSDFRQIWDNQTIENGRYQIYLDTRFALFGSMKNHSILDIQWEPFFARSEDTVTMFGQSQTAVTYAVQNGDKLDLYAEETDSKTDAPKKWLRTSVALPTSEKDTLSMTELKELLPEYNDIVRSVKLVDADERKGQLYAVTLDGRTFYKSLKQYYETKLEPIGGTDAEYSFEMPDAITVALSAESNEADGKNDKIDPKMMRTFVKEVLETWKNTDSIVILARVQAGEITAIQTELAPQFNSMMHVVTTAMDMKQGGEEYKLGGLMEAFLRTDKMRLTIVRDGSAQHTAVPQEIIRTAEETPIEELMPNRNGKKPASEQTETK